MKCRDVFGLKGVARVDFRVDEKNRPWVIEINTNPCLQKDAGLMAAAQQAGLTHEDVIARLVSDLNGEKKCPAQWVSSGQKNLILKTANA
jgi:D-alanine-D-alanine ligase